MFFFNSQKCYPDAARFFSIQTPLINNGHSALNTARIEFVSGSGQPESLRVHVPAASLWPESVRRAKKNIWVGCLERAPSAPSNSKNSAFGDNSTLRRSPALARQTMYSCQTFMAVISTNVSHPGGRVVGVGVFNRQKNASPWARGVLRVSFSRGCASTLYSSDKRRLDF